jgi:hypothetical protein
MIDIKSNLDRLEDSASTFYRRADNNGTSIALSSGDALQTASDLRGAIQDIQNLRDHITNLEKAPVDLGAVINDAINGRIKAALTDSRQLDGLEARLETLEQFKDDLNVEADDIDGLESFVDAIVETHISDSVDRDNETRDTIKDMINDGDIVVSIDVS